MSFLKNLWDGFGDAIMFTGEIPVDVANMTRKTAVALWEIVAEKIMAVFGELLLVWCTYKALSELLSSTWALVLPVVLIIDFVLRRKKSFVVKLFKGFRIIAKLCIKILSKIFCP